MFRWQKLILLVESLKPPRCGPMSANHTQKKQFNLESLEENPAQNHPTFTSPV
jgi:hypothetical protein